MLFVVRGLEDDSKGVYIRLRILEKYTLRTVKTKNGEDHNVVEVLAGDRTGAIILSLWDELSEGIDPDELVDLNNAYTSRFRGRLRLNVGRYGSLVKVEDPTFPTKEQILGRYRRRRKRVKAER
jgi:replication factor A1